jgi:hypothetical protein
VGLLKEALRLDPAYGRARRKLVDLRGHCRSYTIHGLPAGVLAGRDGATAGQCDELRELLGDFQQLVSETSQEGCFTELSRDCDGAQISLLADSWPLRSSESYQRR